MVATTPRPAGPLPTGGLPCFPLHLAPEERRPYLHRVGFHPDHSALLAGRMEGLVVQVDGLPHEAVQALRDLAGRADAEVAHPGPGRTALLLGTWAQLRQLAESASTRTELEALGAGLSDGLARMARPKTLVARGSDLLAGRRFLLMGVVNVTPDSFSDGGRFLQPGPAVEHALRLAREGADILDLGAESSRPGSDPVPEVEERRRLMPVLSGLRRALPGAVLSVDTTKASVARAALDAGADLVNDTSGGTFDPELVPLCAARRAPLVLMHTRGAPRTMQAAPHYEDVLAEVAGELRQRVAVAETAGLGPGSLVVDPGFGFAKRPEDNLALIAHLEALTALGYPILVGASRKSTIGALTGAPVEERLPGSIALHTAALLRGASILRVHDVREHRQALDCAAALMG